MRAPLRDSPVARQILLLQVAVVVVLVVGAVALAGLDARRDARAAATERAVAVARAVADSPAVVDAVSLGDPAARIQPYAEQVRVDTGVDFVVVMDLERIRFSHPDPANIGRRFVGDVGQAPQGRVFTQEFTGTLGPSMRAVVPVRAGAGTERPVVAMVAVGITVQAIDRQLRDDLGLIGLAAAVVLGVGLAGAWLVSRRLRRQTHGLGEQEITRMYEYYSAVLHAVREGLLLVDGEGRVQLVNDEARRLLDLPDDVVGRPLEQLGLAPALVAAARDGQASDDDVYLAGERALVVSAAPARWAGREVGAVVTLRDHTELRSVTGELDVVRGLTESLRAQTHEASNRLHTVVSLIEMGRAEEAVAFATEELEVAQRLADSVVEAVGDPVVAALLLGKTTEATERGIELEVTGDLTGSGVASRELVTVLGNLLDNAFDAVTGRSEKRVRLQASVREGTTRVVVGDSGPGLSDADATHALDRGWSTKASNATVPGGGRGVGLALVAQVARRHDGAVEIDRSPLGGARFAVTLRRATVGTPAPVEAP
ncbi:sensor histidine kinase [Nocardioides nanhaiensis]|uniref:histidine kinase n=1 Tax=Nocardioides nanhaiensis TaxID=1476871 RepID=A0ABP8X3B7_9ACTN